jgi:signal transduction histidine kinase
MRSKILIVDDSPLVRKFYKELLGTEGYDVAEALDGVEAINKAFTECPDLILLDINMPKINGYQVCRLLKDHPATRQIPIIIETSRESAAPVSDPRQWSFVTGADGYMDKSEGERLAEFVKPFLEKARTISTRPSQPPLSEIEIMSYLSKLLDKQLYADVTRLKDLDARKNAFVNNVAHEFKSPLRMIRTNLDMMKEDAEDPLSFGQTVRVDKAIRTVNRLYRLVEEWLDLSKIEAGKISLTKASFDVRDVLNDLTDSYGELLKEKRITLATDYPSGSCEVEADRDRLLQVFINLFANALKFTPENGTISLSLALTERGMRFEIRDTGSGIERKNLEKIFDKFECVVGDAGGGTGLGLAIAKDIVALHGGKIWVESEPGRGSRFVVEL